MMLTGAPAARWELGFPCRRLPLKHEREAKRVHNQDCQGSPQVTSVANFMPMRGGLRLSSAAEDALLVSTCSVLAADSIVGGTITFTNQAYWAPLEEGLNQPVRRCG